ncbi:hypothetical protein LCM20_13000 [Halobacillus litoralis]|uniref:hypothetical protein n=1 Tax=Halobacillus litoralis TaxID=45668 RepID=UPI001CD5B4AC|nr:hypothetical protein [Halobacillus litoralis]MCA0971517.1 hypothetical protein [Halobacillus litoralis]
MKEVIWFLSDFADFWHDLLLDLYRSFGWNMSDTELHFWIIGVLGVIGLLFVDVIFHALARFSITAISFLFSFAIVLVFVFALEIQQKIAGSGNMQFSDAVAGLLGFLFFCLVYFLIRGVREWLKKRKKGNEKGRNEYERTYRS